MVAVAEEKQLVSQIGLERRKEPHWMRVPCRLRHEGEVKKKRQDKERLATSPIGYRDVR